MRGNLDWKQAAEELMGSIPAHAGKPEREFRFEVAEWVYPRACGET